MLVLSRRLNEKVLIPCIRTAIQVLAVQGNQVRLGVEAPSEVTVFREEIYQDDSESVSPARDRDAEAKLAALREALRKRLAGLALDLNRAHRSVQGKRTPGARAELVKLAGDFEDLAGLVKVLLEEDVPEGKKPARRSC